MSLMYRLSQTRYDKRMCKQNRGIVALMTVVIIALFLFSVGILLAIQSRTSIISGKLANQADQAQFLAETGVQDALIKIARNKDYTGAYTIAQNDDPSFDVKQVAVNIATSSGTTSVIVATSTVTRSGDSIQRTIQATVTYDSNGKISIVSKINQ